MKNLSGTRLPQTLIFDRHAGYALAIGLAVAAGTLTGCTKRLNNGTGVGSGERRFESPTIANRAPTAAEVESAEYPVASASLTSLDRDNWQPIRVSVPNALPAHQPIYHGESFSNTTTERTRGRYPTYDSVTVLTNANGQEAQIREAVMAPLMAAGDILLWPARAVYKRPWFVTRGGMLGGRYDRSSAAGVYNPPEPVGDARFPMVAPTPPQPTVGPDGLPVPAKSDGLEVRPRVTEPVAPLQPAAPAARATPAPAPAPAPIAPANPPAAPAPEPDGKPATHTGISDPLGPKN